MAVGALGERVRCSSCGRRGLTPFLRELGGRCPDACAGCPVVTDALCRVLHAWGQSVACGDSILCGACIGSETGWLMLGRWMPPVGRQCVWHARCLGSCAASGCEMRGRLPLPRHPVILDGQCVLDAAPMLEVPFMRPGSAGPAMWMRGSAYAGGEPSRVACGASACGWRSVDWSHMCREFDELRCPAARVWTILPPNCTAQGTLRAEMAQLTQKNAFAGFRVVEPFFGLRGSPGPDG